MCLCGSRVCEHCAGEEYGVLLMCEWLVETMFSAKE